MHKKSATIFTLVLVFLPLLGHAALDTEGNELINAIKISYGQELGPSYILDPKKLMREWAGTLKKISTYVNKNGTTALIMDSDLKKALAGVMTANNDLIKEINKAKTLKAKPGTNFKSDLGKLGNSIKNIDTQLNVTQRNLEAAKFNVNVSYKENARAVLLEAITYTQNAITNGINKINEEVSAAEIPFDDKADPKVAIRKYMDDNPSKRMKAVITWLKSKNKKLSDDEALEIVEKEFNDKYSVVIGAVAIAWGKLGSSAAKNDAKLVLKKMEEEKLPTSLAEKRKQRTVTVPEIEEIIYYTQNNDFKDF